MKKIITVLLYLSASIVVPDKVTAETNTSNAKKLLNIEFLYLKQATPPQAVLSNIFPAPPDSGVSGARLGVADSNTTGRFLNHHYAMDVFEDGNTAVLIQKASTWLEEGRGQILLADLPAKNLLALANAPSVKEKALIFNVSAKDDSLRTTGCAAGLLHTGTSRAMLGDALGQFLISRKWRQWLLVQGQREGDRAFADALRRSAKRYGAKIVDERTWTFDTDLRRSAQQELPLFTQAKNYDVVVVADEYGDVGEYLPYNTWLPRPVAGTQGLTPVGWHRVVEQWGAAQLQRRFAELSQRSNMTPDDYAAWLAVRSVSEALTRTQSTDATTLYAYLFNDAFELAGFKGRKLSFRSWNGQLRQPIPLVQPRALISQSPQAGFLHPRTELDTLGFDKAETTCAFRTVL